MGKKKATAKSAKKPLAAPKKASQVRQTVKQKEKKKQPPSLGRPKVTAEEKLFMLFKEDYHARQIFEFLRADTVRDLEQWSPDEIVRQLSQPIKQSVERIRRKLAEYNRCLRDDMEFALKHSPKD